MSAVNETHYIDFTTAKENRKTKNSKRKTAVPSEWKRNKTKLLRNTGHKNRNFKRGTDVPEQIIVSLLGPLVD